MKVGDLVQAKAYGISKTGFITNMQDRHNDGYDWYFIRFTIDGKGMWYHPSKIEVISESS